MDQVVPSAALCAVIRQHDPKDPAPGAGGRRAVGLERMLRIHFLQRQTVRYTKPSNYGGFMGLSLPCETARNRQVVPEVGLEPTSLAAEDFLATSAFAADASEEAAFVVWSTPSP